MNGPAPGTPGYRVQLLRDRQLAAKAKDVGSLKTLASRYGASLSKSNRDVEAWRKLVVDRVDQLLETAEAGRLRRSAKAQGSLLRSSSTVTSTSRRGSVSSVAPPAPAGAEAGRRSAGVSDAGAVQGPGVLFSTPGALHTPSASRSSAASPGLTPPSAATLAPQVVGVEAGRSAAPPQPVSAALNSQVRELQQLVLQQQQRMEQHEQLIASLQERLAASEHANRKLQQQLQSTHAAGLRHADQLAATEQQVQELLAAHQQQQTTRDEVSKLHSRQEQLQHRQQLEACQLSVVFKDATPLPAQGAAAHLEQLLNKKLSLSITVQSVKQLGTKQQTQHSSSTQRSHAYKVTLGSGGERTAVLRAKAQRLKGSSMSIGPLLTPEQLRQQKLLLPAARQAKSAGMSVRWHYGNLYVDGKQYTGVGSLPTPAEQQATGSSQRDALVGPAKEQDEGWQVVQSKKQRQQAAGSSCKAADRASADAQKSKAALNPSNNKPKAATAGSKAAAKQSANQQGGSKPAAAANKGAKGASANGGRNPKAQQASAQGCSTSAAAMAKGSGGASPRPAAAAAAACRSARSPSPTRA